MKTQLVVLWRTTLLWRPPVWLGFITSVLKQKLDVMLKEVLDYHNEGHSFTEDEHNLDPRQTSSMTID